MGREGGTGGGDGSGEDQKDGKVVSFSEFLRKKRGGHAQHEQNGSIGNREQENDTEYRLQHGFNQWSPEYGASDSEWQKYFLGIYRDVSSIEDRTKASEYFNDIASRMLFSDLERILCKKAFYARKYPEFFGALERQKDACEKAKRIFEVICVEEGIQHSAPPETYTDLLSDFELEELKQLLALGPDFFSDKPGALIAIKNGLQTEAPKKNIPHLVISNQGLKNTPETGGNITTFRSPLRLVEKEKDPLALLAEITKAIEEADEILLGQLSYTTQDDPLKKIKTQQQAKDIIEQGIDAVLVRCSQYKERLRGSTRNADTQGTVIIYTLLRDWASKEKNILEKNLINTFLERADVKEAYERMQNYLQALEPAKGILLKNKVGSFESSWGLNPTYKLLEPSKIKDLNLSAHIDACFLALVALLRERLREK